MKQPHNAHQTFALCLAVLALAFAAFPLASVTAGESPQVEFKASNVGPRELESLTAQRIVRDYTNAWISLADAFNSASVGRLNGYFVGNAQQALAAAVSDHLNNGLRTHYLDQKHVLEPVFYSPEGDLMQLHDTLTCRIQLVDNGNVIDDQQVVLNYVVLMTPESDRWAVRQLQVVPSFQSGTSAQ